MKKETAIISALAIFVLFLLVDLPIITPKSAHADMYDLYPTEPDDQFGRQTRIREFKPASRPASGATVEPYSGGHVDYESNGTEYRYNPLSGEVTGSDGTICSGAGTYKICN